jgi:hypothetical protein
MSTQNSRSCTAQSAEIMVLTLLGGKKMGAASLGTLLGVNWRTARRILEGRSPLTLEHGDILLEHWGYRMLIVRKECFEG